MATATPARYTQSQVTHVEAVVTANDIKVADHRDTRRVIQFGEVYVYLDAEGVTALLKLLFHEPEIEPLVAAALQRMKQAV